VPRKFPDGRVELKLYLPNCCFPAYRDDGKPSQLRVVSPDHPITAGIPLELKIPQTEMYDEPFQVPEPDEVLFEERWAGGEWFRSGMLWNVGKGNVFYFRPGHETYPIYQQKIPLKILSNAARWLAEQQRKKKP
jgi:trehalose utilization protein